MTQNADVTATVERDCFHLRYITAAAMLLGEACIGIGALSLMDLKEQIPGTFEGTFCDQLYSTTLHLYCALKRAQSDHP